MDVGESRAVVWKHSLSLDVWRRENLVGKLTGVSYVLSDGSGKRLDFSLYPEFDEAARSYHREGDEDYSLLEETEVGVLHAIWRPSGRGPQVTEVDRSSGLRAGRFGLQCEGDLANNEKGVMDRSHRGLELPSGSRGRSSGRQGGHRGSPPRFGLGDGAQLGKERSRSGGVQEDAVRVESETPLGGGELGAWSKNSEVGGTAKKGVAAEKGSYFRGRQGRDLSRRVRASVRSGSRSIRRSPKDEIYGRRVGSFDAGRSTDRRGSRSPRGKAFSIEGRFRDRSRERNRRMATW